MLYIVLIATAFATVHVYAAVLAIGCLARDPTLERLPKVSRMFVVLAVPVVASLFVLRSTAELSPEALPSRRWLRVLKPLLHVKETRPSESGMDTVRRAEAMQPGQTSYLGGHNR